jgi:hypothetical protein
VVVLRGFTRLVKVGRPVTMHTDAASGAVTQIIKLHGDKRIKWQGALELLDQNQKVRGGAGCDAGL